MVLKQLLVPRWSDAAADTWSFLSILSSRERRDSALDSEVELQIPISNLKRVMTDE